MKLSLFILLTLFLNSSLFADECIFDQKERILENIKLQKKYLKSTLSEDKLILTIPENNGVISLNIGGCSHYGVSIELKIKKTNLYNKESEFMKKILYLSEKYSQGNIDQKTLKKVIGNKNWENHSGFYFINYEEYSTFETYKINKENHTVIGINYYS